jgi:hypothetical protein
MYFFYFPLCLKQTIAVLKRLQIHNQQQQPFCTFFGFKKIDNKNCTKLKNSLFEEVKNLKKKESTVLFYLTYIEKENDGDQ